MALKKKHIAPYFPWEVQFKEGEQEPKVISALYDNSLACPTDFSPRRFDRVKLILRPLSDLAKDIEQNGERFVPMGELLKITLQKTFNYLENFEVKYVGENSNCYGISARCYEKDEAGFSFSEDNSFDFTLNSARLNINQLELYTKLFEWKFDIFNLIEKGEAIDVNTLKVNPYK